MPTRFLMVLLLCFLGVPQAHAAQSDCGEVTLLAPQPRAVIADRRPMIEWIPVEGAYSYRLFLQSRVPEGQVIATIETHTVETRFLPPQPLTEWKSLVTVQIQAECGGSAPDTSKPATAMQFAIDTSPSCVLADALEVNVTEERVLLIWPPLPDAISYEVSVYTAGDGQLLVRQIAHTAHLTLFGIQKEIAVVGVRPSCRTGMGEGVYRVVPLSLKR